MEKFSLNFSKPEDQEKFSSLSLKDKDLVVENAINEGVKIKKKAKLIRNIHNISNRRDSKPEHAYPLSENYAKASRIIDKLLTPWETQIQEYKAQMSTQRFIELSANSGIIEERSEIYKDSELIWDKSIKFDELKITTYDISQIIPDWYKENIGNPYTDQQKRELEEVINNVTHGDYSNPKMFTHSINAFGLRKGSFSPTEKIYEGNSGARELWLGAGGSHYFNSSRPMIIFDPKSENFTKYFTRGKTYNRAEYSSDGASLQPHLLSASEKKDLMDEHSADAFSSKDIGIVAYFDYEPSWASMAKWIIDIKEGKLYKIDLADNDKTKTE